MAAAETAKLLVSLSLKDDFSKGVKSATASLGKLDTSLGKIGKIGQKGLGTAATNLAKIGAVAAVGVGAMVRSGIDSLAELESAVTSVDGAIAQMGLTGGVTGKQIAAWANEIESAVDAAFDDKAITAATANLIRYGKVAEDNLRPAMVVMTDLAARTGDVDSASNLLARALADPAKAAGKLAKSGVVLTKAQQDTIKAMVEVNDIAGAQTYLLEELAKTTTGAARDMNGPYKDAMLTLADVTEDAQKALAVGFLPVLTKASKLLKTALSDPAVMRNIEDFGKTLASGLDSLISIAQNLPWGQIGDSLKIAGAGAKAVLGAFSSLPPWVQTAVLTGWGLNKLTGGALGAIVGELGKGLVKGVLGMTAGVVNINAAKVIGPGSLSPGGKDGGLIPKAGGLAALGLSGAAMASAVALGAGIALPFILTNVIPELFKGRKGSSGPTVETIKSGSQATEAVWNTVTQSMQKTYEATTGVAQKVSTVSADIRNGFSVQASALKNGFAVVTAGGSKSTAAIRNGFNVNQQKTAAVAAAVRSSDSANASRLGSLNAAVNRTTSTLAAKNFSPRITVPVNVNTTVSVRAVTQQQVTVARYTGGVSTGYTIQ